MEDTNTRLVLTNCPDQDTARLLARTLVELNLAACVNILGRAESVYRWQGKLETETEIPILIKCSADNFTAVKDRITDLHPYELPEIIAVPIVDGLEAYLTWIKESE